jgi:tetratricopeptide (TPR) repeat protein
VTLRRSEFDSAVTALKQGRVEDSLDAADRYVTRNSSDDLALVVRAEALRAAGRHREAIVDIRRAIELRPQETRYQMMLAETLADTHQWDQAAVAYQSIPATAPDYYEALLGLATVERDRGRLESSFNALTRAILADADRYEGYEQMALLLAAVPDASIQNLARAQQAAELALARAVTPADQARALDTIGVVFAAEGDFITAETYAREALRVTPNDELALTLAIEGRIAQYRQRQAFVLPRVAAVPRPAASSSLSGHSS